MSLELLKWKVKDMKERCALEKIYSHTFAAYINLKRVTSRFKDRIEYGSQELCLGTDFVNDRWEYKLCRL